MADSPWLVARSPRPGAGLRVVCLPFAGGNAGAFDAWGPLFPEHVEVCAVRYPGRRERVHEPSIRRMSLLVAALRAGLEGHLDRPYVLFGHSLGAKVAFELARRVSPAPRRLVVSSSPAPHHAERLPDLPAMTDHEVVTELVARGTMPAEVARHPELVEVAVPAIRADYELARTYRFRDNGPVGVPIDAVAGEDDSFVTPEALRAWGELTTGAFTSTFVPGGHDLLSRPGHVVDAVLAACEREPA
ncbi:hypothetical protein ALI22I_20905 [Saccharothrix sp. ALI-22-I]|uniref:thioesterase II family protein n=1 Tax=Saccharothrix sp. ALI-22-I TaxID=1933778 RepID=UPI00097C9EEE|nr:alpha/beta fold hydrolase [Saccharothrix sp. ALI-22-I]ONI87673.1 hypothetical protein ALI22I_20905 [Saccharothrix sp. ALI-22-I]